MIPEMPEDKLQVVVSKRRGSKTHGLCKTALYALTYGRDVVFVVKNKGLIIPGIKEFLNVVRIYGMSFETKYAQNVVILLDSDKAVTFMDLHTYQDSRTWKGAPKDHFFKIADDLGLEGEFDAISINGIMV